MSKKLPDLAGLSDLPRDNFDYSSVGLFAFCTFLKSQSNQVCNIRWKTSSKTECRYRENCFSHTLSLGLKDLS